MTEPALDTARPPVVATSGGHTLSDGVGLRWSAVSVRGRRAENEDTWAVRAPLFVVADGMGGYAAGAEASSLVASAVVTDEAVAGAVVAATIGERIRSAHERVVARSQEVGRTMGSTLTGAAVTDVPGADGSWSWLVFNVGDSRAYVRSGGVVRQVSVDHSVVQELLDAGRIERSQASRHPERHVVTRALGTTSPHDADYWTWPASTGDRVLLCSDGLLLVGDEATVVVGVLEADDPGARLVELLTPVVDTARDNVTVVVVELLGHVGELDDETTLPRSAATP